MPTDLSDLLRRAQHLEVKARHLARSQFAGLYRSAFRGLGMEFSDVREYSEGDEIRLIDWNVSARSQALYVKRMAEERERNVLLLLDTSGSMRFGTARRTKFDLLQEIGALLALACSYARDRVSLALVRSRVEYYVPAARGWNHTARLVREIAAASAQGTGGPNLDPVWGFLNSPGMPRSLTFLLTDYQAPILPCNGLAAACRKHELVVMFATDPRDWSLPSAGRIRFVDAESGRMRTLNSSSADVRRNYEEKGTETRAARVNTLRNSGSQWVEFRTDKDYEPALRRFLLSRSASRA
jgi:uncharacterized protein (DUF58 family)